MPVRYQSLEAPRFSVLSIDGREEIRLKPRRPLFLSIFLTFWLCAWTAAGLAVGGSLLSKQTSAFLLFWLGMWAVGWCYAAVQLAWLFGGSESLSVRNGDLEITYRILGVPIRRVYRGSDLRNLTANATNAQVRPYYSNMPQLPFLRSNKTGSIKFSYGARTVYAGGDLDEEEGRRIAGMLLKRLPSSAKPQTT